ncbi:MAG: hypothetical protein KKA60_10355, partial [Proteobacteria bacterium]|nr:hypothetical protein [Pseudomonadota bacterium]
ADVLASGAGNCQAYSTLFDALCSLAGIRSATISGYARGFGYDPAAPENPLLANHAWNAVFLDGGWRLVDVTWDAGCLDSAGVFSRRYSTAFLFPEPGKFLYTHLPTEPGWQLLDPPATPEQFAGRPYLRGEFHAMGLSLAEPVARINPAGREAVLVLDVPNDVRILAREQSVLGAAAPPESTFIRREKNRVSILATFPRPGRWKLKIFARRLSEPDHGLVAVVAYDATEWGEHRYPYRYQAYSSLKCSLVGPLSASLTPNQKSSFSIRVPGVAAVSLLLDDEQWVLMNRAGPDLFCATATVPESGDVKILVKPTLGDNEWIGLVRYP